MIVRVPRWHRHTKLDLDVRRNTKHWAHDEYELCQVGDLVRSPVLSAASAPPVLRARRALAQVRLEECRALSKRKSHVVAEILKKEDGSEPPSPFPKW